MSVFVAACEALHHYLAAILPMFSAALESQTAGTAIVTFCVFLMKVSLHDTSWRQAYSQDLLASQARKRVCALLLLLLASPCST